MKTAYLSLGSNLSDRETNLRRALGLLASPEVHIKRISATYETEPRDQFVYHDLLVGAIAGGRIVHVMTDPSHRDAWIERLEQHLPRVIRPYNERIE